MLQLIIGVGIGIVVASAVWFFVWRNNKELIKEQAEKLDKLLNEHLDKI